VGVPPCYVIDYSAVFPVAAPPQVVWSVLEDIGYLERCSTWLQKLVIDSPGLREGSVIQGVVATPLTYRIQVTINLEQCVRPRLIVATVHGDLEGEARLSLTPDQRRTRAEVRWTVEMLQRPMRVMARVAHPVLRRGHDTVVQAAIRVLASRVLELDGTCQ
jgi:carbon monoxide dehydrogenase subunit G